MITYKIAVAWLHRALQNPSLQTAILAIVALVGALMENSLNDVDKALAAQTQALAAQTAAVDKLQTEFQLFKGSVAVTTDRLSDRVDLVEKQMKDVDERLRRREAEFEAMMSRQARAMDLWEAQVRRR